MVSCCGSGFMVRIQPTNVSFHGSISHILSYRFHTLSHSFSSSNKKKEAKKKKQKESNQEKCAIRLDI